MTEDDVEKHAEAVVEYMEADMAVARLTGDLARELLRLAQLKSRDTTALTQLRNDLDDAFCRQAASLEIRRISIATVVTEKINTLRGKTNEA